MFRSNTGMIYRRWDDDTYRSSSRRRIVRHIMALDAWSQQMPLNIATSDDTKGQTHTWIACPGCGYGGEIGIPLDYPADVVVCPKCREVVNVRPKDRVLWRPLVASQFLRRQFPNVAWDSIEPAGDSSLDNQSADARHDENVDAAAATVYPTAPPHDTPSVATPVGNVPRLPWPVGLTVGAILFLVAIVLTLAGLAPRPWLANPLLRLP